MTCISAVLLLVQFMGCGARKEYLVDSIDVTRSSWDTVKVDVSFSRKLSLGDPQPVETPPLSVRVFDSSIDTLYVGSDLIFAIPDAALNDREIISVEACASFGTSEVCAQKGIVSSPKRVLIEDQFEYPLEGDYDSGEYEFTFKAERQVFDSDDWESIPLPDDRSGLIVVNVQNGVGDGMSVPFTRRKGKFELENRRNNADFRRDLLKGLLEDNEVTVAFDVFTNAFAIRDPILQRELVVDSKSLATREVEAGLFVEETSRRLVGQLRTFPLGPQRFAYLDSWSYDRESRSYTIRLSFGWRSSFIRSRYFDLSGILTVNEDGSDGSFEITSGNSRGLRRWDQRFGSRSVAMEALPVLAGSSRRVDRTAQ
ncbi:MAG: hypothetical protein HKN13_15265 [Rhodothermales bacterium]|nr:hypothetical protein [Rhodothermales bacterium]